MRIFAATADTRTRRAPNGFTLVELMVVLAIMALAATAVVLTIPGEERTVRSEADRLAALRDEAPRKRLGLRLK